VCCDAPPYAIVRACQSLGFVTPEDVRWCRIDHFLEAQAEWRTLLQCEPWKPTKGWSGGVLTCSCGQDLPRLDTYTFTLASGKELCYQLGQCRRCRAIFWNPS
jgi:hypothetical protein